MSFFKKLLVVILVLLLIGTGYFIYFLLANKAPITQGEVIYAVEYKDNLSLDIYSPTNEIYQKHPVVVFFHGGGWFAGRKESINFNRYNGAVSELRRMGYYIITPEYSLATKEQSPFPNCIEDAFDVLTWVKANQEAYGFDLDNVGIFGESAGAHVGMMLSYSQPEDFSKEMEITPKYVIDIYGPTELEKLFHAQMIDSLKTLLAKLPSRLEDHLDISKRIFGFDPDQDSLKTNSFFTQYSPVSHLTKEAPPTLLIHGNADQVVPIEQSILLNERLEELGVKHEFHTLENVNHAFLGASQSQKDSVQAWISTFILDHYN